MLYRFGGIPALLAATVLACGAGIPCAAGLAQGPGPTGAGQRPASPLPLLRDGRMALFTLLAAGFSLAFLLINFFYADKLQALGLDEAWLSPLILGYSLVQMLAERILEKAPPARLRPLMLGSVLLSAGLMALFAVSSARALVLPVMLLLPLALAVPGFLLESLENKYIDRLGQGVSQAIGTGGRDLSAEIGGIMMLDGLRLLEEDPETRVIVLISKPLVREVAEKILARVSACT